MENEFLDNENKSQQDLHIGLKILSFCIPLAGAILYFVKKDQEPKAAKDACTFALIGVAVGVVIQVVVGLMAGGMGGM